MEERNNVEGSKRWQEYLPNNMVQRVRKNLNEQLEERSSSFKEEYHKKTTMDEKKLKKHGYRNETRTQHNADMQFF